MTTPVALSVQRPPRGDWTWSVAWEGRTWRHSTFLGNDLSPSLLRLQSEQGAPTATAQGRALAGILTAMDGSRTIAELAAELRAAAPQAFPTDADALAEVRALARRYGERTR